MQLFVFWFFQNFACTNKWEIYVSLMVLLDCLSAYIVHVSFYESSDSLLQAEITWNNNNQCWYFQYHENSKSLFWFSVFLQCPHCSITALLINHLDKMKELRVQKHLTLSFYSCAPMYESNRENVKLNQWRNRCGLSSRGTGRKRRSVWHFLFPGQDRSFSAHAAARTAVYLWPLRLHAVVCLHACLWEGAGAWWSGLSLKHIISSLHSKGNG